MAQITGSITRLVFRNPETTYTVLRLAPDRTVRVKPTHGGPHADGAPAAPNYDAPAASDSGSRNTSPQQASFIEEDSLPKLVTVVGDFSSIEVGQQLWVMGDWMDHPAHGRQFRADRWKVELPTTLAGMQASLASGLVRGIGPSLASAIVDTFRERT